MLWEMSFVIAVGFVFSVSRSLEGRQTYEDNSDTYYITSAQLKTY